MRSDLRDNNAEQLTLFSALLGTAANILTGNVLLTHESPIAQCHNANGVNRTITLPEPKDGRLFVFSNVGSLGTITIKDHLANTVVVVQPYCMNVVVCYGALWTTTPGVFGPSTGTPSAGLVPSPGASTGTSRILCDDGVWRAVDTFSVVNYWAAFNDGTNTATPVGTNTFKFRSSDGSVNTTITNNDPTHGDNLNLTMNSAFVQEFIDDRVAALFVQGNGISLTYNDPVGTFTVGMTGAYTGNFSPTGHLLPGSGMGIRLMNAAGDSSVLITNIGTAGLSTLNIPAPVAVTGGVTSITATIRDDSTLLASTAFVKRAIDHTGGAISVKTWGAVGDGNVHPLSEFYGSLAAAQVVYPEALSLAEQTDRNALRRALSLGSSIKGNIKIPTGKYILDAGQSHTPYQYGAQPDRWTAPRLVGEGRRQVDLVNQSAAYAFTYDLANSNHAWDGIDVEGFRLTQASTGGGFKFLEGTAQALFRRVEFNGMAAGARAISIETPGGIFDLDVGYCRFIGEDFPFIGQALFTNSLIINTHWHDNFMANVATPGATSSIRDAVMLSCESSEFAGAHTVANSNFDHTYWELAGFCFNLNFQNNYQEGTGGCFVRVGKDSTTINLDICNYNSYQYGQEVFWMVGTPSEMVFDGRNRAFNVHVDEIFYKNHNLNRGGGYIFNDPWHDMDGEGVHRFWNIKGSTNVTSEPQAQRLVEQLLTGLDHTGAMVSVYNQDETWRRSGRGRFPANADQGVGNATNYTIFLPTDVPATRGAWAATTAYTYHDEASVGANVYECRGTGTSGVTPPTGTNPDVDVGDGVLLWRWLRTSGDALKSQPGGYELNLTVGTSDFEHCLTANYKVIFDNRTTNDYTVCRAEPYDYQATKLGKPGASAIIGLWVASRSTYFGINLPLAKARAVTGAATAQTDFTILVNGVSKGTIRFAAGAINATFIAAAPFSVQPGDYLAITAPAVADATLEDIAFNLAGELMHPKGGAAPRYLNVSVSNVGVVSVSAIQGGGGGHRLWFSWKKLQGLA